MNKNLKTLLTEYPEISLTMREFFLQEILNSIEKSKEKIPEFFVQGLKETGVSEETLLDYYDSNPRLFYDFFDEYDIRIFLTDVQGYFSFTINGSPIEDSYIERKTAEQQSVLEAIIVYKNTL